MSNASAQVAVKTAGGITERNTICNSVMQGTVWGNIFCVALLDKLGKYVYDNPKLLYYYKQSVPIPPLEMVDDVLAIQKCGTKSIKINTAINTFMEAEKLYLSEKKCNVIHVGSKWENCNELKVHNKKMHESKNEKYLGDSINSTGTQRGTIQERKQKGYGIVSQIVAIVTEAPLGCWRMKSGMLLRNSMLVNSMLFNSEAWHGIVKDDVQILSRVDESLLRALFSAHSKTPKEALFLESGQLPIKYIWASRRLNFLQTILKRGENEITRKVYEAQKLNPKKGDFVLMVREDKEMIQLDLSDHQIELMDKSTYQNLVKTKVKNSSFVFLQGLQVQHSKIKDIKYHTFKMQDYMYDPIMSAEDIRFLFALRTRTVRGIRKDFEGMFQNILCPLCKLHDDTIPNLEICEELRAVPRNGANYGDIFSPSVDIQRTAAVQFRALLQARDRILDWEEEEKVK